MARFFIDRPVFAWVVALAIMLVGLITLPTLPISQYPNIAPPEIRISLTYPGASAETVQNTVVQVIEQQMTGLDGLLYFRSDSNRDGSASLELTFAQGTNPDIAQVQVQNRLALAEARLPETVRNQGIRVAKASSTYLMVIGFISTDGSMNAPDIADFIASTIQDPLTRTAGVGDFNLFGAPYAMRIWLDPDRLNAYEMNPSDVATAIRAQNVQVASGEVGALPAVPGQRLTATLIGPSLLNTPEQFASILLRTRTDGSQVRLRDVATVELDAQSFSPSSLFNGRPAAGIGVQLAAGANAVSTATAVRELLERLRPAFPAGLEVVFPSDTTPFVEISIREVVRALIEAMVLIFVVMFIFLQSWRVTLVPTLAIPVVLLGTFAVLGLAGYSINTLTMFAMVLALGMLVDDAIVVVENVERVMKEDGVGPVEATRRSMDQVSGALIGTSVVVAAVFLPTFFFAGSSGVIYRQFALTIITAMTLSVIVALVFNSALCATLLLRPETGERRGFFGWFNRNLDRTTRGYVRGVRHVSSRPVLPLIVYAVIVGAMAFLYIRLPTSFLPAEDQGIMYVQVTAPPGATAERTQQALVAVNDYLLKEEGTRVEGLLAINGFSFGGRGQASGMAFVRLKHWDERTEEADSVSAIAGRVIRHFSTYRDAQIVAFSPPAVPELGNASGFDMMLLDRAGLGRQALSDARDRLLASAGGSALLQGVRQNALNDEPQLHLDIDWERATTLGLAVSDVTGTLSAAFGLSYVNDFLDRGRIKRVYMQGNAPSRMLPEDLSRWHVRNAAGQMVSFGAFASVRWDVGSPRLSRYGGTNAIQIQGDAAAGQSTGAAMVEMERLAEELPQGIGVDWTGLSYEERAAGANTVALYGIALIAIFLCLAAIYESWAIPISVMLIVPLGIFGTVLATLMRGMSNDVYFQVGLLTVISLAVKNAILIVEFAKEHFEAGESLLDAALSAAKERLRPILMTSITFILGMVPLAIATGAGAGGRTAIGTGIIGGMISGTVLVIFFVPLFFVLVLKMFRTKRSSEVQEDGPAPEAKEAPAPAAGD